jgi:hypothetical protein
MFIFSSLFPEMSKYSSFGKLNGGNSVKFTKQFVLKQFKKLDRFISITNHSTRGGQIFRSAGRFQNSLDPSGHIFGKLIY